ncbi:MAG: hypothetical protein PHS53_03200 [Candidatus Pacebacteria bacterium]|nr:hypothetical protein [Candidatus Paceibacterota bacterium]
MNNQDDFVISGNLNPDQEHALRNWIHIAQVHESVQWERFFVTINKGISSALGDPWMATVTALSEADEIQKIGVSSDGHDPYHAIARAIEDMFPFCKLGIE